MRPFWMCILIAVGVALVLSAVRVPDERIPYARFRDLAESGQLTSIDIQGDAYVGRAAPGAASTGVRSFRTGRIESTEKDLLADLDKHAIPYTRVPEDHSVGPILLWLLPIGVAIVLIQLLARPSQTPSIANPAISFGKNKARIYEGRGTPVTFRDVAGSGEAKAELAEIVEFLRTPDRFRRLGARIPKGVLLVGPPGTGKTLLAKAVAGEANVPFFSVCGSEFVEMFVGVGAARVRDLFAQAREKPVSILFVDELDAVGKARGVAGPLGGNDEREQTLNQLLTEMDGFDSHTGMIVLAATNRPEILDPALLRPGRFDRRVHIDRPDQGERQEILEVHARKVLLGPDVDLRRIAGQTSGLVGADLANVVNEAALLAARRRADAVAQSDLDESIERSLAGLSRKGRRLGDRERRVVAYHESGHALMAELLPSQDPVRKVSIIPRGPGALGYTLQQPGEDRYLLGRQEMLDRLVVLLGGRVAEEETVGEISTGAQDDLLSATDLARSMVRELGMSDSLGLSTFDPRRGSALAGAAQEYSDLTARAVDAEVARLLADAQARARALLAEHRETLERVAGRLLEVETVSGEELRKLMAGGAAPPPRGDASPGLRPSVP
jgi:cell division protease FtsH